MQGQHHIAVAAGGVKLQQFFIGSCPLVFFSHTPREVDDTIQSLDLDPISCKSGSVRILILHPCFQVFANFRSVPFSATAICCNKEKIFKDASIEVVHITVV